jgi:RND superfamily putative drug exporter
VFLVDATVIRLLLVPATLTLLGRANWWLPGWLDRVLPRAHPSARPGRRGDRAAGSGPGTVRT